MDWPWYPLLSSNMLVFRFFSGDIFLTDTPFMNLPHIGCPYQNEVNCDTVCVRVHVRMCASYNSTHLNLCSVTFPAWCNRSCLSYLSLGGSNEVNKMLRGKLLYLLGSYTWTEGALWVWLQHRAIRVRNRWLETHSQYHTFVQRSLWVSLSHANFTRVDKLNIINRSLVNKGGLSAIWAGRGNIFIPCTISGTCCR